jgi:penicillin amidase
MERETTRRAVLGAVVGAGVAGGYLSPARSYLDRFAPLSGSVWGATETSRQSTVDSPYGPAEVRYDEYGVPNVSADDESALYFAVGYTQGTDRLFQLELQRRLFSGRLSELVGDVTLDSDRFHRKMAFRDAAEATVQHLEGTRVESVIEAYVDGVNAAIENEQLPVEFELLEHEPEPWTKTDTALVEKIISWQLTGSFRTLRRELARENFDAEMVREILPSRFDDVTPIIREFHEPAEFGEEAWAPVDGWHTDDARQENSLASQDSTDPIEPPLLNWLGQFEPRDTLGSNSWVVGPELASGDAPILSNDPHLTLQAPPVWYEMHLDGPNHRVRGVSFPGTPFVVIGENDHGAWGFTNPSADVIDFYRYDHDGDTYKYGDERREFDVETQEIVVSGGENETIEVKTSVHGPFIEEAEQAVGVAWTGHAATETTRALYGISHNEGVSDALDAVEQFESPPQNMVFADRDGNRFYHLTGRVPLRKIDGDYVRGDQIFDGSAREGEWGGFEPFERPSWDGFVPVSENPHVIDPAYLSTANQQMVPDERVNYYLAESYTSPYRGQRIYELLDERVASGESIDLDFLRTVGRDTYDGRAADLVDPLVEAAREDDDLTETADLLAAWDYHMDPESEAALVFDLWLQRYREAVFDDPFEEAGIEEGTYPPDKAIAQLPADSDWFGPNGRGQAMRAALRDTLAEIDDEGHDVYGDINHTGLIEHPLGLEFLGYPSYPRGGAGHTVWNFGHSGSHGGSWEMQIDLDGTALGLLPGGNNGRYFSNHYDDQLERWANGEYRELSREIEGDLTIEFEEGDR